MTHATPTRSIADLLALAARLRLWLVAIVVRLAEARVLGALQAPLRRWAHAELRRAEHGAMGIIVLLAMTLLPRLPQARPGGRRPRGAPHGFAWATGRGAEMRGVMRPYFPRLRDLDARLRRLDAVLDDVWRTVRRVAKRIEACPPLCRLVLVMALRDVAFPCAPALAMDGADTS